MSNLLDDAARILASPLPRRQALRALSRILAGTALAAFGTKIADAQPGCGPNGCPSGQVCCASQCTKGAICCGRSACAAQQKCCGNNCCLDYQECNESTLTCEATPTPG
jgi:hypothetical protein